MKCGHVAKLRVRKSPMRIKSGFPFWMLIRNRLRGSESDFSFSVLDADPDPPSRILREFAWIDFCLKAINSSNQCPDSDPDADPAIFIIDLQDANKKLIKKKMFLHTGITFWSYINMWIRMRIRNIASNRRLLKPVLVIREIPGLRIRLLSSVTLSKKNNCFIFFS
jgi:hypothetical protein